MSNSIKEYKNKRLLLVILINFETVIIRNCIDIHLKLFGNIAKGQNIITEIIIISTFQQINRRN